MAVTALRSEPFGQT